MNEPEQPAQPLPAAAGAASRGARLCAAREAAGLTQEDIAARLRLSVRQVQALEHDEQDALPSGPFFRGFLRNYARTVGCDPAEFDLEPAPPAQIEPAAMVPLTPPQPQRKVLLESGRATANRRWLAAAVITLALGALGSWLRMEHLRSAGDLIARQAEPQLAQISSMFNGANSKAREGAAPGAPATASGAAGAQPVPGSSPQAPLVLQASTSVPSLAAGTLATDHPPPVIASAVGGAQGGRRLALDFDADCWVEVRDENNQVLLSGLSRAGDHRDVEAHGPVRIVVGNAPATRLSWNGRPVDLAEFTRLTVARLTLDPAQDNP